MKICKLSEIAKFKTGKLNSNAAEMNGRYPFFTCAPEPLKIDTYAFDTKAIILAGNNAEGNFHIQYFEGKFNAYQRTYIIETIDNSIVDIRYLYYALKMCLQHFKLISQGTATKFLTAKILSAFELPIPTIEEQQKIAFLLSGLDEKVKTNERINNNLEQQAQAIYQQMFIDNARSDWAEGTLSDIADITMGQSPNGSSYNEDGTGTIFFQGRAEFGFRFPSVRLYTTEPKRMARLNDTLMSVRAPVGDLNVAHMDCCIGRGLAAIHSKSHHQSFVLYTMFSLKKQLDVFNGEGTVFGSINRNSLNDMPILIPSDDILDEFERIVAPMDLTIRNNYDENCRLQDIRDTLLPRLMSGELDVSDIDL
jgi:type I restriction enzyme S subunit